MKKYIIIGLLSLIGCTTNEKFQAGDICSVENGNGQFGIVKILVIDPNIFHIKLYANKYSQRPKTVDLKELSLGKIADKNGFGIGHLPIDSKESYSWKPEKITSTKVEENELEGYKIWKDQ